MYYNMSGFGSVGESVYIDSQQPWLGTYESTTNLPTGQTAPATEPKWWEKILTVTDKALDVFNPNLAPVVAASQPVEKTSPSWGKIALFAGGAILIAGTVYYVTKKKTTAKRK